MANIKSIDRATEKWKRQSSVSGPEYKAGIEAPRTDWAAATLAAENNYNAGVQAAIARKAFGKGVQKAGSPKWKDKALSVGVNRWSEGISTSTDAYAKGFGPFRDVISKLTLPPRGAKGSPGNIQRVAAVANALHEEKLKRQAAGQ